VTLTTRPHLELRSRMSRSYISSPTSACIGAALDGRWFEIVQERDQSRVVIQAKGSSNFTWIRGVRAALIIAQPNQNNVWPAWCKVFNYCPGNQNNVWPAWRKVFIAQPIQNNVWPSWCKVFPALTQTMEERRLPSTHTGIKNNLIRLNTVSVLMSTSTSRLTYKSPSPASRQIWCQC
jgi:hypothetical protein